MKNKIASKVLLKILDARDWTQGELAARTGIARSMVSEHLSGQRAIRDDHLNAYLTAFDHHERQIMLSAWVRDTLSPEVISDVLNVTENRVREEVAAWSPGLDHEQKQMLGWWAQQLARDPELDAIFRAITRKAGYTSPTQKVFAIVITDAAGRTIDINPAFTRMCGYTLEQLRGRKPGHVLQGPATEQEVVQKMRTALRARHPFAGTLTNYDSAGNLYRVHLQIEPVYNANGELIQFKALEEKVA